jgi:glycerophosphoryl diester phosphodiesterase
MPAFERAQVEGAGAIELDVRTCADGEVVVFHDPTLARMTLETDRRRVCDVTFAALRSIDLGAGARVPTLAEVLEWARPRDVAVNIEMKHDVPSRLVLARATIRAVRSSGVDALVSSFDPLLLAAAAAWAPAVLRALLTHSGQPLWADALQETVRPPLVRALHLERVQAEPRALGRYARRGLRIGAWTVNDPREARHLVGLGVASVITDAPGDVVAAIIRR